METVRQRIIYHGRVQGVGFRYTTASIARRHPVRGYVKNLLDRTVEVVVEGKPEPVREFLGDIDAAFEGNITDRTVKDETPGEPFTGFEIRY